MQNLLCFLCCQIIAEIQNVATQSLFHSNNWFVGNSTLPRGDSCMAIGHSSTSNIIWILGGWVNRNQLIKYDITTDAFIDVGTNNFTESFSRSGQYYNQYKQHLYVINFSGTKIFRFNVDTAFMDYNYSVIPTFQSSAACLCILDIDDGYIIVIGSYSTQILNMSSNYWITNIATLNQGRLDSTCNTYNNKIFVIGGHYDNEDLDSIEVYNFINDTQSQQWNMIEAKLSIGLSFLRSVVYNDKIIVFGGFYAGLFVTIISNNITILNARTHEVYTGNYSIDISMYCPAAINIKDRIYLFGGRTGSSNLNSWRSNYLITIPPTKTPTNEPTNAPTQSQLYNISTTEIPSYIITDTIDVATTTDTAHNKGEYLMYIISFVIVILLLLVLCVCICSYGKKSKQQKKLKDTKVQKTDSIVRTGEKQRNNGISELQEINKLSSVSVSGENNYDLVNKNVNNKNMHHTHNDTNIDEIYGSDDANNIKTNDNNKGNIDVSTSSTNELFDTVAIQTPNGGVDDDDNDNSDEEDEEGVYSKRCMKCNDRLDVNGNHCSRCTMEGNTKGNNKDNETKCNECGQEKKGVIDNETGLFYCDDCWRMWNLDNANDDEQDEGLYSEQPVTQTKDREDETVTTMGNV